MASVNNYIFDSWIFGSTSILLLLLLLVVVMVGIIFKQISERTIRFHSFRGKGANDRRRRHRRQSRNLNFDKVYEPKRKPVSSHIHPLSATSTLVDLNDVLSERGSSLKGSTTNSSMTDDSHPLNVSAVRVRRIHPIDSASRHRPDDTMSNLDSDEVSNGNMSTSSARSAKPIMVQVHSLQDKPISCIPRRRKSIHVKIVKRSNLSNSPSSSSSHRITRSLH